jgi:hypothetical protein
MIYPKWAALVRGAVRPAIGALLVGAPAILLAGTSTSAATAAAAPAWRDTPVARLEALALIQTINGEILASTSATLTLERWCRDHGLAEPALVTAHQIANGTAMPTAALRRDLQIDAHEVLRYRRVRLSCGAHVLSIADNWYVPGRLTADMNHQLDSTLTPFGKVIRPLMPYRQTIGVRMLWSPLRADWARAQPGAATSVSGTRQLALPAALFEHRAIVYLPGRRPVAEVDEVYQRGLLAFAQPRLSPSDAAPAR